MLKEQKLQLRRQVHHLHPVVILGQHGLTPEVHQAIDEALEAHELIKIRVNASDKEARQALTQTMLEHHHAELIQSVGHVVALYRKSKSKPKSKPKSEPRA